MIAKGKVLFSCHGDGDSLFDNWYLMHSYHPSVLAKIYPGETDKVWCVFPLTTCFLWKAQKLHEACPAIVISWCAGWHLCDLGRCFDRSLTDLTCTWNAPEGPKSRPEQGQSIMKQKSINDCQWAISAGDITSESLHVTISQAEMIRQVYLPTKPNKAQWTMVPCMESKRAWEKSLYCSLFDDVW